MAKVVRRYYDKEQTKLKEEYFEVNGKKEGEYKAYYKNGQFTFFNNFVIKK
jgi:antitoxin component YwqK of YwqJK toxin-antitoxin module